MQKVRGDTEEEKKGVARREERERQNKDHLQLDEHEARERGIQVLLFLGIPG